MFSELDQQSFLERNRISSDVWMSANISWDKLREIGLDHEAKLGSLTAAASYIADVMQTFSKVHSVRWRVKDTEHLLEKIVRKRAAGDSGKYNEITIENYSEVVTDLVGVRALHLFKVDFLEIDAQIRETWNLEETAKIYLRNGDQEPEDIKDGEFNAQLHPKGYRSIHYIISTQPQKAKIFIEIQVRTIFEEGWSEIDHQIRYPNFSDNSLVEFFLQTFNRISGSADEMGSFVKALASELDVNQNRIRDAEIERDNALKEVDKTINAMQRANSRGAESTEMVGQLRAEIDRLKAHMRAEDVWKRKTSNLFSDTRDIKKFVNYSDTFEVKHFYDPHRSSYAKLLQQLEDDILKRRQAKRPIGKVEKVVKDEPEEKAKAPEKLDKPQKPEKPKPEKPKPEKPKPEKPKPEKPKSEKPKAENAETPAKDSDDKE